MNGPVTKAAHGGRRWLGLGACLLLVLLSMQARVWRATSDVNFASAQPEGLLKSDPALLYYFTERILEAEGAQPEDFRRDLRVQHPGPTDIPAEFTVGQEYLLAWAYMASGSEQPLALFATRLMALLAACSALGVYGVVLWRSASVKWALAAAALYCLLPANYRTIGFILIREDLSLPLFLGHLALLARAESLGSVRAYLLSGLVLGLALASWHAMGFFVVLELLVLHAWFLWSDKSPFESRGSWAVLIGPVLAATLVPAMQASGLLFGLGMQLALALLGVAFLRGRHRRTHGGQMLGRGVSMLWAGGLLGALAGLGAWVRSGPSSYSHVFEVMQAKLVHFGQRPMDPTSISFDARLLWQGPFEALPAGQLGELLGWCLWLVPAGLWLVWRGRQRLSGFDVFLLLFALGALPTAWLIGRMVVLAGALLPMLVFCLPRMGNGSRARAAVGLLLVAQLFSFVSFLDALRLSWYTPPERQAEIAGLVHWVEQNLSPNEPIVGDFMNSTSILAHSRNPIVLQPKYETERSRLRAQRFLETFFEGSPEALRDLVRGSFQSELLLVDRHTLGRLSPWVAGSPRGPRPGSIGAVLLSQEEAILDSLPGYELLYRSPAPSDYFRLYRLR